MCKQKDRAIKTHKTSSTARREVNKFKEVNKSVLSREQIRIQLMKC